MLQYLGELIALCKLPKYFFFSFYFGSKLNLFSIKCLSGYLYFQHLNDLTNIIFQQL